jgi:hypothetical protein
VFQSSAPTTVTAAAGTFRRAAVRATLAHSVLDTQPWRLHVTDGGLEIHTDPSRWLQSLDATGRRLTLSVGCAVMNARVSVAADGSTADVDRFPDPSRPDLSALLTLSGDGATDQSLAALGEVLERRRAVDDTAAEPPLDDDVVAALEGAAFLEDCRLMLLRDSGARDAVVALRERTRRLLEGHQDDRPGARVAASDWSSDGSEHGGVLAVLGTADDRPSDWLRAGEALQRVLLESARHGLGASPYDGVVEVPVARAQLRRELAAVGHPQAILRLGAPGRTVRGRHRRLVEVLTGGAINA